MAASAILAIKILADATKANSALADSSTKTSKWSSGMAKAGKVAALGLAAVGAVVLSGVKAAAEDAQGQAVLAKAMQNTTGASKKQVAATEDWITKQSQATGVTDDELRPALGALVRATGSVTKSQQAATLAMDISAATGKDVQAVSVALAKGYSGNTAALGKLVPGIDKATIASGDMAAITAELAKKTGGSAAAAADTAAGKYKILSNNLAETKEGIGAALLPVIGALATKMQAVSQWAQDNTGTLTALLAVIGGLAAIIVTVNAVTAAWGAVMAVIRAATIAWRVAQFALNVVLLDNPVGIVIVAITALVAIIILAYKHSQTFRTIVDAAFRAVQSAASFAFGWIKDNWPLLLAIITGPIGLAVLAIVRHWDAIKSGAQAVIDWFKSAWDAIKPVMVAPFAEAWALIKSIIDKITSAVSSVTDLIKKIPHPSIPHIPGVNSTAATSTTRGATTTFAGVARAPAASASSGGGGGVTINVHGAVDPEGTARQIRKLLGAHDVRVGRAAVVAR